MLIVIISGLAAGLIHVLTGPDHLAAVAPLSVRSSARGWLTGARWGMGHSAGVLMVGLLSLVLREVLPLERLSGLAERLVGVMLIGIGWWALREAARTRLHAHVHSHDGAEHVHWHAHQAETAHLAPSPAGKVHRHSHAAVAVGTLHGLAGSSHFLGVLPAMAFRSRFESVSYLLAFGLGTVIAMALFSACIRWVAAGPLRSVSHAHQGLMRLTGVAALVIGAYWLVTG